MKSTILASILFPALAVCQDYGSPTQASTTTTAAAASSSAANSIPTIAVAQNGLTFSPNSLTAAVGSKVVFEFFQAGHTVTQADFNAPCVMSNGTTAINSGLSTGSSTFFTVTINSTDPIWLYCAQVSHCQAGMVAVINPPSGETIDQFATAAKAAPMSNNIPTVVQGGTPGQPSGSASASSSASASASAKPNAAPQLMNQQTVVIAVGLAMLSFSVSLL